VAPLDAGDLREVDSDVGGPVGIDLDPIHRGFVGVERHEGLGDVRLRGHLGVDQDDPVQANVSLGDPSVGVSEDLSVIVGDRYDQGSPFSASEGESELAGLEIEVEGSDGNADEGSSNVGNSALQSLADSGPVAARERTRDLGRGDTHRPGNPSL